jgi:hypothetical protein
MQSFGWAGASRVLSAVLVGAVLVGVGGCGGSKEGGTAAGANNLPKGPHGGSIIDLGAEPYRLELIHDRTAGTVTLYMLDAAAQKEVPVSGSGVAVNVTREGIQTQYVVRAENQNERKTSKYVSTDKFLSQALDAEGNVVEVLFITEGKTLQGKIPRGH